LRAGIGFCLPLKGKEWLLAVGHWPLAFLKDKSFEICQVGIKANFLCKILSGHLIGLEWSFVVNS
jgi:hypothetical protein